jgi:transcription initiation factor TFIIIB Brf1 subunit/transcription initiation factor TFIIB
MDACKFKHTKYEPTEEEFMCPKCGAKVGHFCIDEGPNMDCDQLHDEDNIVCYGVDGKGCPAEYGTTGKKFVAWLLKKNDMVPCECCKGKGFVRSTK